VYPDPYTLAVACAFTVLIVVWTAVLLTARSRLPYEASGVEAGHGPWCARCGYSLHGLALETSACPECGAAPCAERDVADLRAYRAGRRRALACWTILCVGLLAGLEFVALPGYRDYTTSHRLAHAASFERFIESSSTGVALSEIWYIVPRHDWAAALLVPLGTHNPRRPAFFSIRLDACTRAGPLVRLRIDPGDSGYSLEDAPGGPLHVERPFDADALLAILADHGVDSSAPDVRSEAEFAVCRRKAMFDGTWRPAPAESAPFRSVRDHLPVGSGRFVFRPLWLTLPGALIMLALWRRGARRIVAGLSPLGARKTHRAEATTEHH
jgi:hypothetical protein